jgi:hypothetical protein
MTTGPLEGPASTYPMFRTPASICFRGPKDVFVPGMPEGRTFAPSPPDATAEADAVESMGSEAAAVPAMSILENIRLSMIFTFLKINLLSSMFNSDHLGSRLKNGHRTSRTLDRPTWRVTQGWLRRNANKLGLAPFTRAPCAPRMILARQVRVVRPVYVS